jgi:hypothetical protein
MRKINQKWWLTVMALLFLLPATFATAKPKLKPHVSVPEGGSALVYVVGAGMTCLGAMVVLSRSARPGQ